MAGPISPVGEQVSLEEAISLGATNLITYGRLFHPKTMRQDSPEFHYAIGQVLYSPARLCAFEVFRDGAKTSLLRVFTAQRVAYGISRTIMYVSSSQTHSAFSVRWLRRQVEYNKVWAQTFGLSKGDKWTDEVAEIKQSVPNLETGEMDVIVITVLAMGITGQIRGFNLDDYRPDLIIADDIQTEENIGTPEQRVKTSALFHGALVNSLAAATDMPTAKLVLLQTPMHTEDIIETCLKDPGWVSARYGIFDEQGNSRWEARWPTEQMKKDKENATKMGRYSLWMKEKECKVVRSEQKTFNKDMLKYWDLLPLQGQTVLSIDPASSDSPTADDTCVMTIRLFEGNIYVCAYSAEQGSMPDKTCMHFFNQVREFRPTEGGVESIGFQRVLAWYIEREMQLKRIFLPIRKVQDRRKKSDRIIQAIAGYLAYGRLYVHPSMEKLIQQLDDYDPMVEMHDDVLDALAMGIMLLNPWMIENGDDERTIEMEYKVLEQEEDHEYESLTFRGAP